MTEGNQSAEAIRQLVRDEIRDRSIAISGDDVRVIVRSMLFAGIGVQLETTDEGAIVIKAPGLGGGGQPIAATADECRDGKATDRFVTPAGLEAALEDIITEERVKDMVWQGRSNNPHISDRAGTFGVVGLFVGMVFGAAGAAIGLLLAGLLA